MCIRDRIRTIQTMSALLENYEQEKYYRKSRQRQDTYFDRNGQTGYRSNYRGNYNNTNRDSANQNPRPTSNGNNYPPNRNNTNYKPNHNNNYNHNHPNNNHRPNYNGGNQYRPTNGNTPYRPNNNNHQYRPNNGSNQNQGNFRRANYVRADDENGGRHFYQGRRSFNENGNQYSQDVRSRESGYDS